jgi:hypothetical protein
MERRDAGARFRRSLALTFQAKRVPLAPRRRPQPLHPDRHKPPFAELIAVNQATADRKIEVPKGDRTAVGDQSVSLAHRIAKVPLPNREGVGLIVRPAEQLLHAVMEPMQADRLLEHHPSPDARPTPDLPHSQADDPRGRAPPPGNCTLGKTDHAPTLESGITSDNEDSS